MAFEPLFHNGSMTGAYGNRKAGALQKAFAAPLLWGLEG